MKINIEHITINIILPQESVQEKTAASIRRGHRTQEENQLKLESAKLKQIALLKHAARVQHKLRVADRLRALFGDDIANSVMAGGF